MKMSQLLSGVLFATIALCLASCVPQKGPVFLNASGGAVRISASYDDGHVIEGGLLEDGGVIWAGYAGGEIVSATIQIGEVTHRVETAELRKPMPGDKWAVFILKKEGISKVSVEEFRRFPRTR